MPSCDVTRKADVVKLVRFAALDVPESNAAIRSGRMTEKAGCGLSSEKPSCYEGNEGITRYSLI